MAASILYLHGFASSPTSQKATAFRAWAASRGRRMETPDLNGAGFSTMTLASQLAVAREALARLPAPVVGVGSSLGGYLTALLQAQGAPLAGAVLMAPAFDFARRMARRLGPEAVARWRREGTLRVYHHSERAERDLGIALLEEAMAQDGMPPLAVPCCIVHGVNDPDVPVELSRLYARDNPGVRLVEVADDHTLLASLPVVLAETEQLLTRVEG